MSKNADRLMSTGMPATQAKEVVTQIEAAASGDVAWADITGKPSTFAPTIGTTATTAKAGDYAPAWGDVTGKPATFPPTIGTTATTALAGNTPLLAIGTTATTAMAGNTPLLTIGTTSTTALAGNGVPNAQIPSISTPGGNVIAPGTLLEVLQAIADLADPA